MRKARRLQLTVWQEAALATLFKHPNKSRCKLFWMRFDCRAKTLQRPKSALLDFFGIDGRPVIASQTVHLHKLPSRFEAGVNLEVFVQLMEWQLQAQFFVQLALGAGVVIFTSVEMTGSARVIPAGKRILGYRPFLDEQFAALIEYKNVDGAML